jgi:hypothetical protein
MWFVNKVIGSVGRFKFGDIDGDFGNVVECVYKELEKLLDRY